jgi:hypothetical protein
MFFCWIFLFRSYVAQICSVTHAQHVLEFILAHTQHVLQQTVKFPQFLFMPSLRYKYVLLAECAVKMFLRMLSVQ